MKYRNKKTGAIAEALEWTGENSATVSSFLGRRIEFNSSNRTMRFDLTEDSFIQAGLGDWIIKDGEGNLSVCRSNDFTSEYQEVAEEELELV